MKLKKTHIYYLIIILLLVYIVFLDSSCFWNIFTTRGKLKKLELEIESIRQNNDKLKLENENLKHDQATWEKKARQLGLQKKGDEIFHFKQEKKSD